MLKIFLAVFVMFFVLQAWSAESTTSYVFNVTPQACLALVKSKRYEKIEQQGVNLTYAYFYFSKDELGQPITFCKKRIELEDTVEFFKKQNRSYKIKSTDCQCQGYFTISPISNQ